MPAGWRTRGTQRHPGVRRKAGSSRHLGYSYTPLPTDEMLKTYGYNDFPSRHGAELSPRAKKLPVRCFPPPDTDPVETDLPEGLASQRKWPLLYIRVVLSGMSAEAPGRDPTP